MQLRLQGASSTRQRSGKASADEAAQTDRRTARLCRDRNQPDRRALTSMPDALLLDRNPSVIARVCTLPSLPTLRIPSTAVAAGAVVQSSPVHTRGSQSIQSRSSLTRQAARPSTPYPLTVE